MSSKKQRGDRSDGRLIKKLDPMHIFMPYVLNGRTQNEAVMNELVDMTAVLEYVNRKNADSPEFKYTIFHVICAAVAKTVALRPKLNYFIMNRKYYERNNISLAFTVKKKFVDTSPEALAIVKLDKDSDASPMESVYSQVKKVVCHVKKDDQNDGATDFMGLLTKIPSFVLRFVVKLMYFLDRHGWLPMDLIKVDPYHTTVFLSNLGSIKMSATYHHLAEWGTNSFFMLIGEMKKRSFYDENGNVEIKDALELGMTIDERIADGLYFINSIKILKKLLSDPELLERPINEPVEL
ncbi:MAG: 2-oxo acid dehydrogenase subunit E2 [Clostridia bacterium]|nr:2-oxo acid dehydrogenase subunit E2 [Clostridia bacterium]